MLFVKPVKMLVAVFCVSTLFFSFNSEARNCKKGKPCGNSCISKNDVCHKDTPSTSTATSSPEAAPTIPAPSVATAPNVPNTPDAAQKTDAGHPVSADQEPGNKRVAKNCKKGKPCGNTCIAQDAVCRE